MATDLLFNDQELPLHGIRVLDMSRILAGPTCAMTLGDLGAEVIKIEHPKRGDDTRDWGMPVGSTQTAYFNSVNRNKRSIGIDLQQPEGVALVHRLVKDSDIVIQNFKPGSADRMGIGFQDLYQTNPRILFCAITGYSNDSGQAERPGYDLVIQAESGLMALNGETRQPPLKIGVAVVDLFTGMYAAQAVLAALHERHRTGKGKRIDLALFDCGLMLTSYYGLEALVSGKEPPRYGNAHPSIVPYGVFDAQDGPLVITVGNNTQYQRFCTDVIECPELAEDARFSSNTLRSANRSDLTPQIETALRRFPRALLLQRLESAGIPCGEVLGLHEALTSPRVVATQLVHEAPHAETGVTPLYEPPFQFDGKRVRARRTPPILGADTQDILTELGLETQEIHALQRQGVL